MTSQSRVLITGSTDGLGLAAARDLIARGHDVTVHARNAARARDVRTLLPDAAVVTADFASLDEVRQLAEDVRRIGPHDVIIHNAAVGYREPHRIDTVDHHAHVFQVNVVAPYLLTALLPRPDRMVWLSSRLHLSGEADVNDPDWTHRPWNGYQAYCDSKLFDAVLAAAIARRFPDAFSNAVEPGWVPTKMGGPGAPDDLALAHVTQVWLAEGRDPRTHVSGAYWFHQQPAPTHPAVGDHTFQDQLIALLADTTGVGLTAG